MKNLLNQSILGQRAIWGCDIVEVCSIEVNGMVNVKLVAFSENNEEIAVNISNLIFI